MEESGSIPSPPTLLRPPILHKRTRNSCLKCRHRKIRCTRERPQCHNCLRLNHVCIYENPPPVRSSSQASVLADSSLASETQRAKIGNDGREPKQDADYHGVLERLGQLERIVGQLVAMPPIRTNNNGIMFEEEMADNPVTASGRDVDQCIAAVSAKVGNLLTVGNGEPQYRTNSHWGQMIEQDLGPSNPEDGETLPSLSLLLSSPVSSTFDANDYLPNRHEADWLYATFKMRVDPVVRVIHKSTFESEMAEYFQNRFTERQRNGANLRSDEGSHRIKAGFEALLFAVFSSAILSLDDDEFWHFTRGADNQGMEKDAFTSQSSNYISKQARIDRLSCVESFQYACCQSLLKSKIFDKQSLPSVSALLLLLFTAYHEAGVPSLYTLVGVLVRTSRSLGLHIDPEVLSNRRKQGNQLGDEVQVRMTPILVETRRRLWHQVLHLDLMACEARGIDPEPQNLVDHWPVGVGSSFPRNFDDNEIPMTSDEHPGYTCPEDRGRHTEMSTQLARFNASFCLRRLLSLSSHKTPSQGLRVAEELESAIKEMVDTNQRLHLQYCVDAEPAQCMTLLLGKMVEHKSWLYHYLFCNGPLSEPVDGQWSFSRQRALMNATELLRLYSAALNDPLMIPFRWHIRRHSQFHAILHILKELCSARPNTLNDEIHEICQQAWTVVEGLQFKAQSSLEKNQGNSEAVSGVLERLRDTASRNWSAKAKFSDMDALTAFDSSNPLMMFPNEATEDFQTWLGYDHGFGNPLF